jgi:REP element-mobilizing transposase RayT
MRLEPLAPMPRSPRVDFPGAVHHVYARGNEKRDLFLDDEDRKHFLSRLAANLARWGLHCIAWAVMPNHFHLLLRCPSGNLASFMRCLLTGYSMYFNKRYDRVGHLFQNRYKSQALTRDGHYRELVRYIHLNPVRAGILPNLATLSRHPWTGHRGIVSGSIPDWQDLESLQELFASGKRTWIQEYATFLERGLHLVHESAPPGLRDLPNAASAVCLDARGEIDRPPKAYFDILERVLSETGVAAGEIPGKDNRAHVVRARRLLLRGCRREFPVPISRLCKWAGIPEYTGWYLLKNESEEDRGAPVLEDL